MFVGVSSPLVRQFAAYFCVGGIAALIEWASFYITNIKCSVNYFWAVVIAFFIATAANWLLGRIFVFKNRNTTHGGTVREALLVFLASAVGLLVNLLAMHILVEGLGFNTDLRRLAAKIISTGIAFFWNFLSRRFFIYRE